MDSIASTAITIMVLVIVFALCMSFVLLILEDNKLDPINSFLVNEVQLAGGLTPEVMAKFEQAAAVLHFNPDDFDFSGSTTTPVARGENAYITYTYKVQANQRPLEQYEIPTIQTVKREFFVKRTGR